MNDPWTLAKRIVDTVQADADFVVADNHAYSIVLTQYFDNTRMYGRVCGVGNNHYYSKPNFEGPLANDKGAFLLFQTR